MKRLQYTVDFNTPAFLGNAQQIGQWRSPPIKTLMRHWWRMLQGSAVQFDVDQLRADEGLRFGRASDNDKVRSLKSPIRLRLAPAWSVGQLRKDQWPKQFDSITTGAGQRVRADVYLGFGPILPASKRDNRQTPELAQAAALAPGDTATLTVICPDHFVQEVTQTLQLVHWFGTLGSRSRNGWGSITLTPQGDTPPLDVLTANHPLLQRISRSLEQCLQEEWAHAIGISPEVPGKPLIWRSHTCGDWQEAVKILADTLYAVRSAAKGHKTHFRNRPVGALHLLGYPAGSNNSPWDLPVRDRNVRLASPLRFKVVKDGDQFRGVIFHTPSRPPERGFLEALQDRQIAQWLRSPENLQQCWKTIHQALDAEHERIA